MSADAYEIPFLRYRTGERIKVGDVVRESVDDRERRGTVDRVYDPDSLAAEMFGFPQGVCSVTWSDRVDAPNLMTAGDIQEEDRLLFVHRGDPRLQHFRYRTGERIELGDVVMEPVNAHEVYGVVDAVWEPGSSDAAAMELPQGCFHITWRSWTGDLPPVNKTALSAPKFVHQQDVLIFIRRGDARTHAIGRGAGGAA